MEFFLSLSLSHSRLAELSAAKLKSRKIPQSAQKQRGRRLVAEASWLTALPPPCVAKLGAHLWSSRSLR